MSLFYLSTDLVVPRDRTSSRGNQGDDLGGKSGPTVPGYPDGCQAGKGALCAD